MHRENDAHTTSAGEAVLEEQQALMPRGTRLSWTPHRVGRPRYRKKSQRRCTQMSAKSANGPEDWYAP
jgi:hypothetical protein